MFKRIFNLYKKGNSENISNSSRLSSISRTIFLDFLFRSTRSKKIFKGTYLTKIIVLESYKIFFWIFLGFEIFVIYLLSQKNTVGFTTLEMTTMGSSNKSKFTNLIV